jgi:hypothetical protein
LQPRPTGLPLLRRFRHYVGIEGSLAKLDRLIQALHFAPMGEVLKTLAL